MDDDNSGNWRPFPFQYEESDSEAKPLGPPSTMAMLWSVLECPLNALVFYSGTSTPSELEKSNLKVAPLAPQATVFAGAFPPLPCRDRSALFLSMRKSTNWCAKEFRDNIPLIAEESDLERELSALHCAGASCCARLFSKLAQHNGLRQFAVDFPSRAPPLELRILVPELEISIKQVLDELELLEARLLRLESSLRQEQDILKPEGIHLRLCCGLQKHFRRSLDEGRESFDEQRASLCKLALAAPLFAPTMPLALSKRLLVALSSPGGSAESTPSMSSIWPGGSSPLLSPECISLRVSACTPQSASPGAGVLSCGLGDSLPLRLRGSVMNNRLEDRRDENAFLTVFNTSTTN